MKVDTPLGEYPFEFRRLERRGGRLAVVGLVAGLRSEMLLERRELLAIGATTATVLGAAAALGYRLRASR